MNTSVSPKGLSPGNSEFQDMFSKEALLSERRLEMVDTISGKTSTISCHINMIGYPAILLRYEHLLADPFPASLSLFLACAVQS